MCAAIFRKLVEGAVGFGGIKARHYFAVKFILLCFSQPKNGERKRGKERKDDNHNAPRTEFSDVVD